MSDFYHQLKAAINANIKRNGRQAITGAVLNDILISMVDALGASVFAVEYGTTTFREIEDAVAADKVVICKTEEGIQMMLSSISESTAYFSSVIAAYNIGTEGHYAKLTSLNHWSTGVFRVDEVHFATFGLTTYQKVYEQAIDRSKVVVCEKDGLRYTLTGLGTPEEERFVFTAIDGATIRTLTLTKKATWSQASIDLQTR